MPDYLRRAIRTLAQLVVSGALTAAVNAWAGGLTPEQATAVLAGWQVVVTFAHNLLEDKTSFPSLLKAISSSGQNPVTVDPAGGSTLTQAVNGDVTPEQVSTAVQAAAIQPSQSTSTLSDGVQALIVPGATVDTTGFADIAKKAAGKKAAPAKRSAKKAKP